MCVEGRVEGRACVEGGGGLRDGLVGTSRSTSCVASDVRQGTE